MNKLAKRDEDRIMSALDQVSGLINDGDDPNAAIAKVATDMRIPAGHVDLLSHAYNTARTNMQRKSSTNIFDKAAEFAVADSAIILSKMYPNETKIAAAKQRSSVVSKEYDRTPTWANIQANVKFAGEKQNLKMCDKPVPYPTDPTTQVKKAYNEIDFCKRKLNSFRADATKLREDVYKGIYGLVDYFKTAGCLPFVDVKANAHIMFGGISNAVLDNIKNRYPACEKKASSNKWDRADQKAEPYKAISKLMESISAYTALSEKVAIAASMVDKLEAQLLRPFVQSPRSRSVLNDSEKRAFGGILGSAVNRGVDLLSGSDIAKEVATQLPGTTPTHKLLAKDLQKLSDPSHESKLREAQVHAMLHDLIANDEIISTHPPDSILRLYNELSQVAPRASNQKMLVRAHLRKRLQYGGDQVDPFEVAQLLDIEQKLRQREELGGNLGAMGNGPVGHIAQQMQQQAGR